MVLREIVALLQYKFRKKCVIMHKWPERRLRNAVTETAKRVGSEIWAALCYHQPITTATLNYEPCSLSSQFLYQQSTVVIARAEPWAVSASNRLLNQIYRQPITTKICYVRVLFSCKLHSTLWLHVHMTIEPDYRQPITTDLVSKYSYGPCYARVLFSCNPPSGCMCNAQEFPAIPEIITGQELLHHADCWKVGLRFLLRQRDNFFSGF